MEKVTLWQGDCLELMKNIPDGSVDLVLTDIPYGMAFKYYLLMQSTARRCVDCVHMTNANRIRSMADAELHELLHEIYNAGAENAVAYVCGQRAFNFEWTMKWLMQPAQEG